jgi:hypothetical protein
MDHLLFVLAGFDRKRSLDAVENQTPLPSDSITPAIATFGYAGHLWYRSMLHRLEHSFSWSGDCRVGW